MIPTRIECGCARTKCGGGVVGQPDCPWCHGEGYRIVQCVECADSGHWLGTDEECGCRREVASLPPDPESMRLARELAIAIA